VLSVHFERSHYSPFDPAASESVSKDPASHRLSGTTVRSESSRLRSQSLEPEVKTETGVETEPVDFSAESSDPKLARLFTVYDQARSEYNSFVEIGDSKTVTAAKFLRDTAENALTYLKGMNVDADVLAELKGTCEMAATAVITLSGGKKRKFDMREEGNGSVSGWYAKGKGDEKRRSQSGGKWRGGRGGKSRGPSGIPYGYTRPVDSYYPY
jgi:hypothetical protein